MTAPAQAPLAACHCCGLVLRMPAVPPGHAARCPRCHTSVRHRSPREGSGWRGTRNAWAGAAAGAALTLYPVAVSQPVLSLTRLGHETEASIWSGSVGLLAEGEWFVGGVVLVCSLLLPLVKLLGLLAITLGGRRVRAHHRAWTYRWIEWTGRWGMLDVLLIAVVTAWVKIGDLVQVRPGPAALAFCAMVVLSLLAAAWFDPHAAWEEGGTDA